MSEGTMRLDVLETRMLSSTTNNNTIYVNADLYVTGNVTIDGTYPAIFRVDKTTSQMVSNNVLTTITFDAEDVNNSFAPGTFTLGTTYTVTEEGWYDIDVAYKYNSSFQNKHLLQIFINGSAADTFGQGQLHLTGTEAHAHVSAKIHLAIGDAITFSTTQTSGGVATITGGYFAVYRLPGSKMVTQSIVPSGSVLSANTAVQTNRIEAVTGSPSGTINVMDDLNLNNKDVDNVIRVTFNDGISIGTSTGSAAASGLNSIAIGRLSTANVSNGLAIGVSALAQGTNSVSIGYSAAARGPSSIAIGYNADAFIGTNNIAIGYNAKTSATLSHDLALGSGAKAYGTETIAIGRLAQCTSAASYAISIGKSSTCSGANTIAIGQNANSSGTNAIAIGRNTTASHTSAAAFGYGAVTTADNSTVMRRRAFAGTTAVFAGGTSAGAFELGVTTSSGRYKKNIRALEDVGNKIDQVEIVRFEPNFEDCGMVAKREHIGVIAEQLENHFPEFVTYDSDGVTPASVSYPELVAVLLREIQSLRSRVNALENA